MQAQLSTPTLSRSPAAPRAAEHDELDVFAGDRSFVMSFARGVTVIQAFANVSRPLSIAEVSHRVHIPRAAVRRLLHTLCELGFVRSVGPHYELTPKILQLGHAFSSSNDIAAGVQPIVTRLAEQQRCFAALVVQDNDETMLMCLAGTSRTDVNRQLRPAPGSRAPLYASASGLVFLGQLSPAQLDAYFARVAMLPMTFRTPTLPQQVRESLTRMRQSGCAICDRTIANNLRAVAVPVRDARGAVVAAMVAVVDAERLQDTELRTFLLPSLAAAAAEAAGHWR